MYPVALADDDQLAVKLLFVTSPAFKAKNPSIEFPLKVTVVGWIPPPEILS